MSASQYNSYRQGLSERKKTYANYKKYIKEFYSLNDFKNLNTASVYDYLEEK